MVLLEPDPFLNELNKLYERNQKSGTVWVTMKRTNLKPRNTRKEESKKAEYKCLIRANDGKKHISTTVGASQYAKFSQSVIVIMKAHMDGLKKKEKEKKKEKK
jgi:signal recognition particle subunit SRP14